MKQIVTYIVVVLLINGCSSLTSYFDDALPQLPETKPNETKPNQSTHAQLALVIGNSEYEYSPLNNPNNEAKDMANMLEQIGFEVILKTNLNLQAMNKVVSEFGTRLSDNTDQESVGLFYFFGYGVQMNGENFLLPINNNNIRAENEVKKHAVGVKTLLDKMANSKGIKIIILDACYDDPYRHSNNNMAHGLARIPPPKGALIAFAAEEGKTVSKGEEHNGLYTKTLLNVLEKVKHNRIEDVFMRVGELVAQTSGGKQTPWYQTSLRKPFCFGGCL